MMDNYCHALLVLFQISGFRAFIYHSDAICGTKNAIINLENFSKVKEWFAHYWRVINLDTFFANSFPELVVEQVRSFKTLGDGLSITCLKENFFA